MAHFSQAQRQELARIFTELTDFMHREGVIQIVGCGPSASPFARAIRRAYKLRHGIPVAMTSLGTLGESLSVADRGGAELKKLRPKLDFKAKTLLLDECMAPGRLLGA